ncbi:MAG: MarR family transcriptional regulator [Planctomycetota bacterium]|nr:MarR family transcriptional regulator [Planctomycetota bacterium]
MATKSAPFHSRCACEMLEVVPLVMRSIHNNMRSTHSHDLSIPQFISLGFLSRHQGSSLSDLTRHLGLSLPTMSRMIDALLARHLVRRTAHPLDRRRIVLTVTPRGQRLLHNARHTTQIYLSDLLSGLLPRDRSTILQAMQILRPLFSPAGANNGNPPG